MLRGVSKLLTRADAGRVVSDYRWPLPGYAALHRAGSRAGTFAPSPEPRAPTATTSAHHHFRLVRSVSQTQNVVQTFGTCLLYTSPSPRDRQKSRMPSSA